MKKLLFLFLPLMLTLASCSDDDDDFDHAIVGKWQFISVTPNVVASDQNLENDIRSYLEDYIIEDDLRDAIGTIFELKSNKKLKITIGMESIEISYAVKGNTLTIIDDEGNKSDPVEFEINNDELIFYENLTDEMSSLFLSAYPGAKVEYASVDQVARKM